MRASCNPIIGPRRTITGPWDQWEVCVHGEETLGTSLHNMSALARGVGNLGPDLGLPWELVWHKAASVPMSHFGEDRMLGLGRIAL